MKFSYRRKSSKIAWGLFWLLIAGLILTNYFGGFVELPSVWSYIFAAGALVVLFHSLATLNLPFLPLPIAALYYIFQETFALPQIDFWPLALVTVLTMIGLGIMLPRSLKFGKIINVNMGNSGSREWKKQKDNVKVHIIDGADADIIIDGTGSNGHKESTGVKIEEGDDANNPYINVSFGHASRYLHADCLDSAELICSFGGLEVYFDNVTLSPDGADVDVNCSFGSIEIYVPSHWRVVDNLSSSLANAEVSRRLLENDEDAPTIRVTGSVSLGNIEIKRIKGR